SDALGVAVKERGDLPSSSDARQRVAQLIHVLALQYERREDAQNVRVGARAGEDALPQQLGLNVFRGPRRAQAEQQARALRAGDWAHDTRLTNFGRPLLHVLEQLLRFDDVQHGFDGRARHRAAAERRAERIHLEIARDMVGNEHRGYRKSRTQCLGGRNDVGRHAVHVRGERIARSADAALQLIEDKDRAVLAATETQCLEKALRQIDRARDALHRLDDYRGRLIVDERAETIDVARLDEGDLERLGRKAVP